MTEKEKLIEELREKVENMPVKSEEKEDIGLGVIKTKQIFRLAGHKDELESIADFILDREKEIRKGEREKTLRFLDKISVVNPEVVNIICNDLQETWEASDEGVPK